MALDDFDALGLPESEGVDRCADVSSASVAMAIAHPFGQPGHFDPNCSAITFTRICVRHNARIVEEAPIIGNKMCWRARSATPPRVMLSKKD